MMISPCKMYSTAIDSNLGAATPPFTYGIIWDKSVNNPDENIFYYALLDSPLGQLLVTASEQAVHHILFEDMPQTLRILSKRHELIENAAHPLIDQTQMQLAEYFAGERHSFDIPLSGQGTDYQKK